MHQVSANYTMPTILNTLSPAAQSATGKNAAARANASGSSSSTSSSGGSGTDLSTTFLTLLAQELQDQDPTAPIDPTAMVGQMISLNQLEQLISINQTVTGASTGTSAATSYSQPAANATSAVQAAYAPTAATAVAAPNGAVGSTASPWTPVTTNTQLPFDPNTMMPWSFTNQGAAAVGSSLNPATMGFSGTNNNTSGGK